MKAPANDNDLNAIVAGVGHAVSALSIALIESGAVRPEILYTAALPGSKLNGFEGVFCKMIIATIKGKIDKL